MPHDLEERANDPETGVPAPEGVFPSLPTGGDGLGRVAAGDADSMKVD